MDCKSFKAKFEKCFTLRKYGNVIKDVEFLHRRRSLMCIYISLLCSLCVKASKGNVRLPNCRLRVTDETSPTKPTW